MLEDVGYRVLEASSGPLALELFRRERPVDFLVTDYAMPGMTGVQLAAAIRDMQSALPILMITGFANLTEEQAEGLPRLSKPFHQAELIARLGEILTPSV